MPKQKKIKQDAVVEEVKQEEVVAVEETQIKDRGTVLPSTIGRKDKPEDDGLIRDCWGTIMS